MQHLPQEEAEQLELQALVYKNLQDAIPLVTTLADDWIRLSFDSDESQAMNDFRKLYYKKLKDLSDVFDDLKSSYEAICQYNGCEHK